MKTIYDYIVGLIESLGFDDYEEMDSLSKLDMLTEIEDKYDINLDITVLDVDGASLETLVIEISTMLEMELKRELEREGL